MGRFVVAVLVVIVDIVWLVPDLVSGQPWWVLAGYVAATAAAALLPARRAELGFVAACLLAGVVGGSFALLLYSAYRAGHHVTGRVRAALLLAGVLGFAGLRLGLGDWPLGAPSTVIAQVMVVIALPMVVGRYLAQHRHLVSALDGHNRQLRESQALLAEQERLRERLRIARDMHDSLGHRLSLASVQAAALEVSLSPGERDAVRSLASSVRRATDELHSLVGALRQDPDVVAPSIDGIGSLVEGTRACGVPVSLQTEGTQSAVDGLVGQAAYRVVEEGLTNAAKHGAGAASVLVRWETDALLVTVSNPVASGAESGSGHGLVGLDERVRLAGGLLHSSQSSPSSPDDPSFRLTALLPLATAVPAGRRGIDRFRNVSLWMAAAGTLFLLAPAGMMLGGT